MTTYVMEAKDHLDTANYPDDAPDTAWEQIYVGISVDRHRRRIMFSAHDYDLATGTNDSGFYLWSGAVLFAPGASYNRNAYRGHMIGERPLDNDTVVWNYTYSADQTVPAGIGGSDGTYRRVTDIDISAGAVPLMVDARSGNVWQHAFSLGGDPCQTYLFRASDTFAQVISPLQDISGNGSHQELLGFTTNYAMLEFTGTAEYVVGTPIDITSDEITADYLLPYFWFATPHSVADWYRRWVIDKSDNVWWFGAQRSGARTYELHKFTLPSAAIPNNAGTVGGGWADKTPWGGSTGPNTSIGAYTYNGGLGTGYDNKNLLYYLPATDQLAIVTKLWAGDTGASVTDPTLTRFDCTYYDIGGDTFDYHDSFVTGYMKADWTTTTDPAQAAWVVLGVREHDLDLGQNSYVFSDTEADYTKRWFAFSVQPVVAGVWTPDTTTQRTILAQYTFAYGSAPTLTQAIIPEDGWDARYTTYATAIGSAYVVEKSMDSASQVQSDGIYIDNGYYDLPRNAFWWSGDSPGFPFMQFDQSYVDRGDRNPPFMRLSFGVTPPPAATYRANVWSTIGFPTL